MSTALIYRDQIVRAVTGRSPALVTVADLAALDRIAEHLADSEQAKSELRAKGYGQVGMTMVEVVRVVPMNPLAALLREIGKRG